jgi:hypothetical protein
MRDHKKITTVMGVIFLTFTPLLFFAKHYSDRHIDYSQLESLLQQKRWIEADLETRSLMKKVFMEAIDSQSFFGFSKIDLSIGTNTMLHPSRSCHSFQRIDKIWTTYSNGKYGFTKQSRIMKEIIDKLGKTSSGDYFNEFNNRVGWTDPRWNFLHPQMSHEIDILYQIQE